MTKIMHWQKRYHELYLQLKSEYDPRVTQWISEKEEIIVAVPFSSSFLGYGLAGIRRYKSGKLRILYALSPEKSEFWDAPPQEPEILFLYVDLRKDETYKEALKLLRKHKIL